MNNKRIILFLHIQKTAGMTLQEKLRSEYGPFLLQRIVNRISGKSFDNVNLKEALQNKSLTDNLFMGHFCYGIHRHIKRDYTYITFLRNPVSRLISLYNYSNKNTTAYYHKHAVGKTPEEFLLNSKLLELDNGMTRFLAGSTDDDFINRTPYGQCSQTLLETALGNISNDFSFIGIQEYFDESMLLMAQQFQWENPYYLTLNISKKKAKNIPESLLQELQDKNKYDIELYNTLSKVFLNEFNKKFKDTETILNNFRIKNKRYQDRRLPVLALRLKINKMRKVIRKL